MPEHRLLACFAHPDDEAFPVGGALAAHARRGAAVRLLTATLGEEGEIRQDGAATRETLGEIRRVELSCAVQALGLDSHDVWDYRDSGMDGWESNRHPRAFTNADAAEVVARLTLEMRRFRPQAVLTFGPDGLYGHPDHIAIAQWATAAFHRAADPAAFPQQLADGLAPYQPQRLFYSVRPRGFRRQWAEALRGQGIEWPLPTPEQEGQGVPESEIHLELDVSGGGILEAKMACILCHRTQVAAGWPYHRVPRPVAARILGREFYVRAHPPVSPGETVDPDFFAGID